MDHVQQAGDRVTRWIGRRLPWVFVFGLSVVVAGAIDSAATRALTATPSSEAVGAEGVRDPCALDVDGVIYGGSQWWLPAGRSASCRSQSYPGLPEPRDLAAQASHLGPLQATLTFASPTDMRIDLYCQSSTMQQRSANGDFVSATEARQLYEQVCTSAAPPP
jgi:hypothetical protein